MPCPLRMILPCIVCVSCPSHKPALVLSTFFSRCLAQEPPCAYSKCWRQCSSLSRSYLCRSLMCSLSPAHAAWCLAIAAAAACAGMVQRKVAASALQDGTRAAAARCRTAKHVHQARFRRRRALHPQALARTAHRVRQTLASLCLCNSSVRYLQSESRTIRLSRVLTW